MIDPNTPVTGRTALLYEVSVYDHEAREWVVSQAFGRLEAMSTDVVLQSVIDAGHDDIRLLIHCTGSADEGAGRSPRVGDLIDCGSDAMSVSRPRSGSRCDECAAVSGSAV